MAKSCESVRITSPAGLFVKVAGEFITETSSRWAPRDEFEELFEEGAGSCTVLVRDAGKLVELLRMWAETSSRWTSRGGLEKLFEEEAGSCTVVVRDVGKLVELLQMRDEEEFVVEESLEDDEVVRASPSAATVLMVHIVAQIIDGLGIILSMVLSLSSFLEAGGFYTFYVLRGLNLSSHKSRKWRLTTSII